jgi:hypothetical protein
MELLKKQGSSYRLPSLQKTHSLLQVLPLAGADSTSSVLQGLNIRSAEVICASCYGGSCVICKPLCELKKTIEFCDNVRSFEASLSMFFCFAFYRLLQRKGLQFETNKRKKSKAIPVTDLGACIVVR